MWRIRNIVADGFMLTVVGLGVIAVHDTSRGNVELAVRFGSLLCVVRLLFVLKPSNITGQAGNETSRLGWWSAVVSVALGVLFFATSAIVARVGFFQVLFFIQLAGPISTFNNAIRDLTSDPVPLVKEAPEQ